MSKFQIAIIGLGSIGKRHLRNLVDHFGECIGVIYIYDKDPRQFDSLPESQVEIVICDQMIEMQSQQLDLVLICTPTKFHYADCLPFIEKDMLVFIEKPAAINYEECTKLLGKSRAQVVIGCNMRYHVAIEEARKILNNNELGEISGARAYFGHSLRNWRPDTDYKKSYSADVALGGGVLLDCIHELDYILWMFGEPVEYECLISSRNLLTIKSEESANLIIKHDTGVLSSINLDYIQPLKRRGLEIIGCQGTYIWTSIGKKPEKMSILIYRAGHGQEEIFVTENYNINESYLKEFEDLFKVLGGRKLQETNLLSLDSAAGQLKIIDDCKIKAGNTL